MGGNIFILGAIPSYALRLLLTQCSGIIPGRLADLYNAIQYIYNAEDRT